MNLDNNLLHTLRYFKTFEESEQDKYFREKLNRLSKLSMNAYTDLMRRYVIKAASEGSVDMNEFDRDIEELLKEDKTMSENEFEVDKETEKVMDAWKKEDYWIERDKAMTTEESNNIEVTQEIECVDWINKIYYLVDKVDEISQLLKKEEIEVTELSPDFLDSYAYKAKVLKNNDIEMVKIGKINEFGILELFTEETLAPIVPSFYQSEFYYLGREESNNDYQRSKLIQVPKYKKFVPKNIINQIVITKEEGKYSTGYINGEGVAIYYDQLPKKD